MKRHETDALSLIFGLLFLAAALWWGIYQVFRTTELPVTLAVAITLVVVGAAGLATAVPRRRKAAAPALDPIPAEPVVRVDSVDDSSVDTSVDLLKREED